MRKKKQEINKEQYWYEKGTEGLYREGEEEMSKSAIWSYYYAINKLKERFKLGEEAISKNCHFACEYALYVIKGRFVEAEECIAKNASRSVWYATRVLKGRFLIAEEKMKKHNEIWKEYVSFMDGLGIKI